LPNPNLELAGQNLQRAFKLQERVLNELYLSGIISKSEWARDQGRAVGLMQKIPSNSDFLAALRSTEYSHLREPGTRQFPDEMPLADAFKNACGREREYLELSEIKRRSLQKQTQGP
jgi:hypothetical protein